MKLVEVTHENGKVLRVPNDRLPYVLIAMYGGNSDEQTANAMEAKDKVEQGGTVTHNGFTLKLIDAPSP